MLDLRKRDDQVQKLNQNDLNQEALKLLEQQGWTWSLEHREFYQYGWSTTRNKLSGN